MKLSIMAKAMLAGLLVAGCNRIETEPRVQQVPKQARPVMASAAALQLRWSVPKDWVEIPAGEIRLAAFRVSPAHPDVVMTIIALPGDGGGTAANLNRWEQQVGLPPTPAANLDKLLTHVDVGDIHVDKVDLIGPETANPRMRMLGAMIAQPNQVVYAKLAGPADVVGPQKANFDAFVQSLRMGDAPSTPAPAAAGAAMPPLPEGHPPLPGQPAGNPAMPPLPEGHPALPGNPAAAMPPQAPAEIKFITPEGWVQDGPMPLRVVSFHIGEGDRRADVIVSKLPATGSGSYAENITRWRNQVGLPPLAAGEQQLSIPFPVDGIAAGMLFDFVGPGDAQRAKRMQLAWVPKDQDWWFFKITGPSDVVDQQRAKFDAFLKSVDFIEATGAPKP